MDKNPKMNKSFDSKPNSSGPFSPSKPRAQIKLLDSKIYEVVLHSRLSVDDVLRLIAEKFEINTNDSRFFALGITDYLGNFHWLDGSLIVRDLVEHSKNPSENLILTHHVRFFVDRVHELQCPSTAQYYFLELYNQINRHELLVNSEDYIELLSILVSIFAFDAQEDRITEVVNRVMNNSHPPYILLKNTPENIGKAVYERFQQYRRLPVGTAMIRFIKTAERSESYGHRMYEALNEDDDRCLISIGTRGIFVYRRNKHHNLITPHISYPWRLIDNLYYRDNKFSIEIRQSKSDAFRRSCDSLNNDAFLANDRQLSEAFNHPTTQVSAGRRRSGNNRVQIYNFICNSGLQCRTIWSSAIAQHQFSLEQQAIRKKGHQRNTVIDQQELTEKLNRLTSNSSLGSSLPSLSSLHSSSSAGTMPSAKIGDGSTSSLPPTVSKATSPQQHSQTSSTSSFHKKTPEEFKRDLQRYHDLRSKKVEMESRLLHKLKELKEVCLAEGNITGALPDEIHQVMLPGDDFPRLTRRVGTSYSIPDDLIKADKADKMSQMETDVELHRRIVAAANRLATDKNTNKSVRKKRQKDLLAARQRLNRLEQGLQQMRHSASKPDISSIASDGSNNSWSASNSSGPMLTMAMTKSCPTTPRGSVPDLANHHDFDDDKSEMEMEDRVSRRAPSAISRGSLQQRYSGVSSSSATSSGSDSLGLGLPPRPNSRKHQQQQTVLQYDDNLDNPMFDGPTNPLYENVGYRSTSYRSSYRQAHYPTIQDEHTQRKRAQSAHSISTDNGANGRTSTYSVPLNDASQKFIDLDYGCDDEEDITPTSDHPQLMNVRRITSSISCQAGFATASLDRRYGKQNGNRVPPVNGSSDDMVRQSVTTRITTFPVAPPSSTIMLSGKPYSSSELPRFQPPPPVARVSHLPRGSLPPYSSLPGQIINNIPITTVSAGKLPMNTNPQMEALLSYYKQKQQHQPVRNSPQPKTATIV